MFTSEEQLKWFMELLDISDVFYEENLMYGISKFRIGYRFVAYNGKVNIFVIVLNKFQCKTIALF